MPSTVTALAQMADHAATQITASHESWTDFLRTAARLYKYPYHEQLMIYAQRPDATACAGYEVWNEKNAPVYPARQQGDRAHRRFR